MVKCSKKQIRELKTALRWKIPEAERQRIQMVLLRESSMTQPAIAEAMGVSLSIVTRMHMAFDHGSIVCERTRKSSSWKRHDTAP
jgi:DNA-directed RNA polymerase specialized sigma subunit